MRPYGIKIRRTKNYEFNLWRGGGNLALLERIKELKTELDDIEKEMITLSASVAEDKDALAVVSEKSRDLDKRLAGGPVSALIEYLENISKNVPGLSVFFTGEGTDHLPGYNMNWRYSPGIVVNRYSVVFVLLLGRDGKIATTMYNLGVLSEWTVR